MAKWITMQEASEVLGVSYKTMQRYAKDKKVKSKKKGNIRVVDKESLEGLTDTGTDIGQDKSRTSPKTSEQESPSKKEATGSSEVEFLRGMIDKQQGTIEKQNDRLSELNKLFAMNQQSIAELNRTLQLQAGGGRTDDLGQNGNDLGQEQDTKRTEKGQSPSQQVKNKGLRSPRTLYFVLGGVLILVILVFVGWYLMRTGYMATPSFLSGYAM